MYEKKSFLMRNIMIIGLLFGLTIQANESVISKLIPYRIDNKWGYVDKNKNTVVDFKYDETNPFSDGLGLVYLNGKCGYIDENGKEIIDLKYERCLPFKNGIAQLIGYGLINKKGEKINTSQEVAKTIGHSVPFVINGTRKTFDFVYPSKWDLNEKFGLIDKNGRVIVNAKYDYIGEFFNGYAKVAMNNKYGLMDERGNLIVPIKYEDVGIFSNGFIPVKQNDFFGVIDRNEKIIIPFEYSFISEFSEGLFIVRNDNKSGYVNTNNEIVIPLQYDYADPFVNGLASVKYDGKCGYINKNGQAVIPFKYGTTYKFKNALANVYLGNNNSTDAINDSGYIDINGVEYFETNNKVSLFGIDPNGASRTEIRLRLKASGVKSIREDDNYWYDIYDTSSLIQGTSKMSIGYTSAGIFAEFEYEFPSHANPKTFKDIYEKLRLKYGTSPWYVPLKTSNFDKCAANFELGKAECGWYVHGIEVNLKRGWPDTTTYLSYQSLDYEKMKSQINEVEAEEKSKKQAEEGKYF